MEHLIGKLIELQIQVPGRKVLFYLARITNFDATHFYFTDRYGGRYGFRRKDLQELKELQEVKGNGQKKGDVLDDGDPNHLVYTSLYNT